jgi:hypothetical protein
MAVTTITIATPMIPEWPKCANDNNHQSRTVATEAQVPGPGRSIPIPKNVPMIHAQLVCPNAAEAVLVALLFITIRLGKRAFVYFFEHLWIKYGRADAVCTAGPFAEIDHAATIAAEREVLIGT